MSFGLPSLWIRTSRVLCFAFLFDGSCEERLLWYLSFIVSEAWTFELL